VNIIVTWPKAERTLRSYLDELAKARAEGLEINFRVASAPKEVNPGDRCYLVYAGFVRGWNLVKGVRRRSDVIDPTTNMQMPSGIYVVRAPLYYPWLGDPMPYRGFQGFRYADF
jgi:hypothetical protein